MRRRGKTGTNGGDVMITELYQKINLNQKAGTSNFIKIRETSQITKESELHVSIKRTIDLKYKPGSKKKPEINQGVLLENENLKKENHSIKSKIIALKTHAINLQEQLSSKTDVNLVCQFIRQLPKNKEGQKDMEKIKDIIGEITWQKSTPRNKSISKSEDNVKNENKYRSPVMIFKKKKT